MDLMSALCSSKEFLISSWLRCNSRLCEFPSVDHGKPSDMGNVYCLSLVACTAFTNDTCQE